MRLMSLTSPDRRFATAAAGALLGLLLAVFALPATAMTIPVPAGGVMPSHIPFTVQWVSTPGPGTIRIDLTSSANTYYVVGSIANTGQASISLPATAVCNPQEVFRVRVLRQVPISNGVSYPDQGYGAPFTFACPITVTKQVVNTTGRPAGGAFRMRVQCEPGSQTIGNILAAGQGSFTRKIHVPAGSTTCTVQETGMPMTPMGCKWLTTYPAGQQRQPGGPPVIVVNTLQCGPTTLPDRRP